MAYGGDYLGDPVEDDYTGLASVDPANPDVVFISTSSNPLTGEPLMSTSSGKRQKEIYMGKTTDYGKTWTWAALTQNSEMDNIRPIVPLWKKDKSVVLWLKGTYSEYIDYRTAIVGQIIYH